MLRGLSAFAYKLTMQPRSVNLEDRNSPVDSSAACASPLMDDGVGMFLQESFSRPCRNWNSLASMT